MKRRSFLGGVLAAISAATGAKAANIAEPLQNSMSALSDVPGSDFTIKGSNSTWHKPGGAIVFSTAIQKLCPQVFIPKEIIKDDVLSAETVRKILEQ